MRMKQLLNKIVEIWSNGIYWEQQNCKTTENFNEEEFEGSACQKRRSIDTCAYNVRHGANFQFYYANF